MFFLSFDYVHIYFVERQASFSYTTFWLSVICDTFCCILSGVTNYWAHESPQQEAFSGQRHNSIQVYLYGAFYDINRCKAALQEIKFLQ